MSSADYLCKQFGPRSGPTRRRAWSGSKRLGTLLIFPKIILEKQTDFEKKTSADDKIMTNYLVGKTSQ